MIVKIVTDTSKNKFIEFSTRKIPIIFEFKNKNQRNNFYNTLLDLVKTDGLELYSDINHQLSKEDINKIINNKSSRMDVDMICPEYINNMLKNLLENHNKKKKC